MDQIDSKPPEYALAKYACDLSFEGIDASDQQHISHMIFDVVGISIGAYIKGHKSGLINEDMVLERYSSATGCKLWSGRGRVPADQAASCNGTWAEILDYQDVVVDPRNNGHLGVTVIPAAIAVAEREGKSGAELITAVAAGLEVAIAVLRAVGRLHRSDGRGFRTTSIAGPLGAAVACAKLLGLDQVGILNAMGIAGACSPNGLMPSLSAANGMFGMDKDWVNGMAAQLAVNSADLAKRGMTGSHAVVTGEMGIVASHSHGDAAPLLTPSGGTPNIKQIALKKFASCYGVHSAMEVATDLVLENKIAPTDIKKVVVHIKKDSAKTLSGRKITNHMAARFSLAYATASAIIRKDQTSMEDFEEPAIFDETVLAMMDKVEIVADPDLTQFNVETGGFPAHVFIHWHDKVADKRIDYPIGSSQRPLSWDDITKKFVELTATHFTDEQQSKILECGKSLSALDNINEFTDLLL